MDIVEKLGNNIRCLRLAYGETQEQLGAAIDVEKNTISSYEKGRTEPKKNILALIAVHFMVSVEELLSCDFSGIDKITYDQNIFWEQIDMYLPVTSSENAQKNEHFKKAYSIHRKLFDELQKQNLDNIDNIMICFEEYVDALDSENPTVEAAANLVGLWYLLTCIFKSIPQIIKARPALIQRAAKDSKARNILENIDPDFEKDADEIANEWFHPIMDEILTDLLELIKKSNEWHELGDYYLALQFVYNLVDNNMTWEFNRRVGAEMLNAFASVGNPYAKFFLFSEDLDVHIM